MGKINRRSVARFLDYAKSLEDVEDEINDTDNRKWKYDLCKDCPAYDFCETKSTGYLRNYCEPYLKGK